VSAGDLAWLYAVLGTACAVAIYRRTGGSSRRRRLASAALAIPLWPLWAPIALTSSGAVSRSAGVRGAALERIEAALLEGVDVCCGTPLESLLSREVAIGITANVSRISARHTELSELLSQEGLDLEAAERRVDALERCAAPSDRGLLTARLHLESTKKLHAMRARDARALQELAELVEALRTQLILARFSGSSAEGVGGIVTEVWARVSALTEALDATDVMGAPVSAEVAL